MLKPYTVILTSIECLAVTPTSKSHIDLPPSKISFSEIAFAKMQALDYAAQTWIKKIGPPCRINESYEYRVKGRVCSKNKDDYADLEIKYLFKLTLVVS